MQERQAKEATARDREEAATTNSTEIAAAGTGSITGVSLTGFNFSFRTTASSVSTETGDCCRKRQQCV